MFIRNSEALRSAGWTVDYPPCFLRKPSSCDVSTFNPMGCSETSGCFNMQRLSDHWKTRRNSRPNLFWVDLTFHQNSTAPPRKRHPHPLTCGILHLPCLPFSHHPSLDTNHKNIHRSQAPPVVRVAGFLSTDWEPNSNRESTKTTQGSNTEYKNTIWYRLHHFEKNYDL